MRSIQPIIKTIATVVLAICAVNSNMHYQPNSITIINITTQDIQNDTRTMYPDMYTERIGKNTNSYK